VTSVDDPIVLSSVQLTVEADGAVPLNTAMLVVTDPDGPAGAVSFTVRNVTNGRFERDTAPGVAITTFSQTEIVAGTIRFVATGGAVVPAFGASASDGVVTTRFVVANVTLTPSAADTASLLAAASVPPAPPVPVAPANGPEPAALAKAPGSAPVDETSAESAADEGPPPMAVPRAPPSPARQARTGNAAPEGGPRAGAVAGKEADPQNQGTRAGVAGIGAPAAPTPLVSWPGTPGQLLPGAPQWPIAGASGTAAIPLKMDPVALANHEATLHDAAWRKGLETAKEHTVAPEKMQRIVIGSSTAVAGSLSVGYVIWLVRGGVLLSSLLSSLPAWRVLDPLPILGRSRNADGVEEYDEDGPDDPLERLFMRARTALVRGGEASSITPEERP